MKNRWWCLSVYVERKKKRYSGVEKESKTKIQWQSRTLLIKDVFAKVELLSAYNKVSCYKEWNSTPMKNEWSVIIKNNWRLVWMNDDDLCIFPMGRHKKWQWLRRFLFRKGQLMSLMHYEKSYWLAIYVRTFFLRLIAWFQKYKKIIILYRKSFPFSNSC